MADRSALLGAKLRVLKSLVFGAGAGPGLSQGWGTPVFFAVGTVGYDPQPHDVVLIPGHAGLYAPEGYDSGHGDPDTAFEASPVRIDATYLTPAQHNNPMEPHATLAVWRDGLLHPSVVLV